MPKNPTHDPTAGQSLEGADIVAPAEDPDDPWAVKADPPVQSEESAEADAAPAGPLEGDPGQEANLRFTSNPAMRPIVGRITGLPGKIQITTPAEDQRKPGGFFHPQADMIRRQFPGYLKPMKKGA